MAGDQNRWRKDHRANTKPLILRRVRCFDHNFAGIGVAVRFTDFHGLPISTTHTLVGAVLGVGLARGMGALNLTTMRDVVAGWIITIPAGAGLSILFYFILKFIFVDSGWFAPLATGG